MVICLEQGADCLHVVQLMPLPSQNPIISRHLKHIKLAVYQALHGTAPHYLSEELCNVADVPVGERSSPVVDLQSAGCPTITPRCLGSPPVLYLCTGVVRTLERLDREAVGRHSLTLMVRDRGTPLPRRSYTTFSPESVYLYCTCVQVWCGRWSGWTARRWDVTR